MCDKEKGIPVAERAHAGLQRPKTSRRLQDTPRLPSADASAGVDQVAGIADQQRVKMMLAQIPDNANHADFHAACLQLAGSLGIVGTSKKPEQLMPELKHALVLMYPNYTDYQANVPATLKI